MRFPPRPGLWLPRLIRFREQLRKSYEQAKEFIGEVEKLKAKVADSYQDFEAGHISQEELGSRLREAITELNELLPENVSERFDAIYPNWESKFLGVREEYLPTENNATSANSEFSPEELAQAYIESLESLADSDFYFLSGVDYIAGSMTDPELDAFVTEMRNLLGTPTPTPNTTSEEIINQIVARVSDGTSVEEIGDILEQIETFNLNPTDIINEIDSRIEKTEPVDPYTAHEHQDTDYNCGPTLVKVISAQHGIDISEGELTLRALLEGDFRLEGRPTIECFEILFGLFSGCSVTPGIDGGTLPRHMGQMFEDLGIPVDYNYSARPVDIEAALAQGKSVIVAVNVGPLWRSQSGGHVLQVLEIKENENVVIVNDTGRDSGAGIEYPLDRFLEACEQYTQGDGIVMITTKEAPRVRFLKLLLRQLPQTPMKVLQPLMDLKQQPGMVRRLMIH